MRKITGQQIKRIHTLKNIARLSEVDYRLILSSRFSKNSSKDLTEAQASVIIFLYTLTIYQKQGFNRGTSLCSNPDTK